MCRESAEQTLFHEITHGILSECGLEHLNSDETIVSIIGNHIYGLIKDNPIYYLLDELEQQEV